MEKTGTISQGDSFSAFSAMVCATAAPLPGACASACEQLIASTLKSEMTGGRIRPVGDEAGEHENSSLFFRRIGLRRLAALVGLCGAEGSRLDDLDGLPGNDFQCAVDHDPVAGSQAGRDQDALLARVVADHHGPQLGGAVVLYHVHEMAVGTLLHRELRHDDRVRPRPALDVRGDEHPWAQV